MQLLSNDDFTALGAQLGFGRPAEYPHSEHWTYLERDLDLSRYWSYPDVFDAPTFVRALLNVGGAADTYWIRPNEGQWFELFRAGGGWSLAWDTLVAGLGVPSGHVGAIGLAFKDPRLEALITLQVIMGSSLFSNALVLPSHGQHLWFFDHHDVVFGEFRSLTTLNRHVDNLAAAGYPLPKEPPDDTFKPVPWQL